MEGATDLQRPLQHELEDRYSAQPPMTVASHPEQQQQQQQHQNHPGSAPVNPVLEDHHHPPAYSYYEPKPSRARGSHSGIASTASASIQTSSSSSAIPSSFSSSPTSTSIPVPALPAIEAGTTTFTQPSVAVQTVPPQAIQSQNPVTRDFAALQQQAPPPPFEASRQTNDNQQDGLDSSEPTIPPPYNHPIHTSRKWLGRYKSEQEYLNALRSWADEKLYHEPAVDAQGRGVQLEGFFGIDKSRPEYLVREKEREKLKLEKKEKKKAAKRAEEEATERQIEQRGKRFSRSQSKANVEVEECEEEEEEGSTDLAEASSSAESGNRGDGSDRGDGETSRRRQSSFGASNLASWISRKRRG